MSEQADLRVASRAFIAAAFAVLREDHLIPTSVYYPYIAVGHDYEGARIMGLPQYRALEASLSRAYPERFPAEPLGRLHPEFATTYIFSFLEAFVARCARRGEFDPASGAVEESIGELLAVLGETQYDVVCCRHVSHLTTTGGHEVQIGNVAIVPEPEGFGGLTRRIQEEISGAARAWDRDDPRPYDPPHSLLIIRETTDDPSPYEVGERLSGELERFLLLARMLTAGTVKSTYEVIGPTTLVSRMNPRMRTFRKGSFDVLVRRTVRLTGDEGEAFAALGDLIDSASVKREGMVATSFDVGLSRFNRSYSSDSWNERLVDLATALEAVLIGTDKETEGLTLRLRTRAAALLATDDDSGRRVFEDVGQLYNLRSKIVHGGQIQLKELRKIIGRVTTVSDDAAEHRLGVALDYAVDRMRDLVRRAILARLCLAAKPDALWPFTGDTAVDANLADDVARASWRTRWRAHLAALGVGYAANLPRPAVDAISQEDQ